MSEARDMRDKLVTVLKSVPAGFTFKDGIGNGEISKKSFGKLITALKALFFHKVGVEIFSQSWFVGKFGGEAGGYYDSAENTFGFLAGFEFGSVYNKSVAVHESIHALQDGFEMSYMPPEHEITAYAGQALYYHLVTSGQAQKDGLGGLFDEGPGQKIFAAADKVVPGLLKTKRLDPKGEGVAELRKAILTHPLYRPKAKKKKVKADGW